MITVIQISAPFKDYYGAKISFKIPSYVSEIKKFVLYIKDEKTLLDKLNDLVTTHGLTPVNFDIATYSILLNNNTDAYLSDMPLEHHRQEYGSNKKGNFHTLKLPANKKVIPNASHLFICKMNKQMIDYINNNKPQTNDLANHLRKELKVNLLIEYKK